MHSTLAAGKAYTTAELKVNIVRPLNWLMALASAVAGLVIVVGLLLGGVLQELVHVRQVLARPPPPPRVVDAHHDAIARLVEVRGASMPRRRAPYSGQLRLLTSQAQRQQRCDEICPRAAGPATLPTDATHSLPIDAAAVIANFQAKSVVGLLSRETQPALTRLARRDSLCG